MLCTAKYKTLEKLVNTTTLPALVEQKPVNRQTDETQPSDVFEPLTLTEKYQHTFLVVNCINDGKHFIFAFSAVSTTPTLQYVDTKNGLIEAKQKKIIYGPNGRCDMRSSLQFQEYAEDPCTVISRL